MAGLTRTFRGGALLGVLLALLVPGAASAARVAVDTAGNLEFIAAPGEANQVGFSRPQVEGKSTWRLVNFGAPLEPGSGCALRSVVAGGDVVCEGAVAATIRLQDGNDVLGTTNAGQSLSESWLPANVAVFGGEGDDRLGASADGGTWTLDGGPGDDEFLIGPWVPPWPTVPLYQALPGSYLLRGGEGNDRLTGFSDTLGVPLSVGSDEVAESFEGGPGDDTVAGLGGPDRIQGDEGDDSLEGGLGDDRIEGGAGDDYLDGGAGSDVLAGGEGNDSIDAVDSPPTGDSIDCGAGFDRVAADPYDAVPLDCESVGSVFEECPANVFRCVGEVTMRAAPSGGASASRARKRHRRILGRGKVVLGRGTSGPLSARLFRRARRIVRKHGRLRVVIRATVERKVRGKVRGRSRSRGIVVLSR